jgi:hypothetical protein
LAATTNAFKDDGYDIGVSEMTYLPLPEYEMHFEESSTEAQRAKDAINLFEAEPEIVAVHSNLPE